MVLMPAETTLDLFVVGGGLEVESSGSSLHYKYSCISVDLFPLTWQNPANSPRLLVGWSNNKSCSAHTGNRTKERTKGKEKLKWRI